MIVEIICGMLLSLLILYILLLYLGWADSFNEKAELYEYLPEGLSEDEKRTVRMYGWVLPPTVLSDTYKYINFWIKYYSFLIGIQI